MSNQAALARFQSRQLQVEDVSVNASVPSDSVARLMYYLGCVSGVLDGCVPSNLTNYRRYGSLSPSERALVIRLACELSPDKVPLFIPVSNLPEGNSNMFFKFSSLEQTVTALGIRAGGAEMMALQRSIGNKQRLIEVMAYTQQWLNKNYLEPLMDIKAQMDRQSRSSSGCVLL